MKLFLLIVGGVVVGLFLFLVLAFQLIKWKLKRAFGDLGQAFEQFAKGMASMPTLRLKLEPAGETPANNPAEIAETRELLLAAGFRDAGRFLPNGNASIIMDLFYQDGEHLLAVAYDISDSPCRLDIAARFEDGRSHFFSNVKHDGLDKPEWCRYDRQPDASNADLIDAALDGMPDGGRVAYTPDQLPSEIEQSYEREMVWRVRRGGYTDDEIRRSVEASGNEATEQNMEMSKGMLQGALKNAIEVELREAFLKTTSLSAARWEAVEDRLAILHPMTDAEALAEHLGDLYPPVDDETEIDEDGEDEDDRRYEQNKATAEKLLQTHTPAETFTKLAEGTPRFSELEHLGQVLEPVPADFFALPPYADPDE